MVDASTTPEVGVGGTSTPPEVAVGGRGWYLYPTSDG